MEARFWHQQYGRRNLLDDGVCLGGRQKRLLRLLAFRTDYHEIVGGLTGSLDDLLDRIAGFRHDVDLEALFLKHLDILVKNL